MTNPINFPFFQTLTKEAQLALKIVHRMGVEHCTIGQASKYLTGQTWNAARLRGGLTLVTETMTKLGISNVAAESMVAEGMSAAAAGSAAGGGLLGTLGTIGSWLGLSGTAAIAMGAIIVTAVLSVPTYYGAKYFGERAADAPIKEGWRTSDSRSDRANPTESTANEPYNIYLVTNLGSGSVVVRKQIDMEKLRRCDLNGGGHCPPDTKATYRVIKQGFNTRQAANEWYCQSLECKPWSMRLWQPGAAKARVFGGEYWVSDAPSCGKSITDNLSSCH